MDDLQVISTDHCPFCMKEPPQKQLGEATSRRSPTVRPGIETRLLLLWDGGVRAGPHRRPAVRRDRVHQPGEDVRPLAAEGHRSRSAPTATSCCGIPNAPSRSPRRRTTCAWTTTRTRDGWSRARPPRCSRAATSSSMHDTFVGPTWPRRIRAASGRARRSWRVSPGPPPLEDMRMSRQPSPARRHLIRGMRRAPGDLLRTGRCARRSVTANADLAPTRVAHRTWSTYHIASLWVGLSVCIPTYMLAASLVGAA